MKILYILLILTSFSMFSQSPKINNHLYDGNEKVKNEDFLGAEVNYRLALSKQPETPKALFNLGNTQYKAKAFDEAAQQFYRTHKFSENKTDKHAALHNMGNVYMKQKEYQKAVESYKSALRNNPSDNETRYNYALAKSLLEDDNKNQKKNNQDKKNKDQKKNEDKNEKSSDQEKQDDDGDEKKNKGEEPNDDKKQDEKPDNTDDKSSKKKNSDTRKPGQLSKDQVKSLLEAMNNQEKKVQDKINAKKVKGIPVKTKKDW